MLNQHGTVTDDVGMVCSTGVEHSWEWACAHNGCLPLLLQGINDLVVARYRRFEAKVANARTSRELKTAIKLWA